MTAGDTRRFLEELAAQNKEPAPIVSPQATVTVEQLSESAFALAYDDWSMGRWVACQSDVPSGTDPLDQFLADCDEFGWRFTLAGGLVIDGEEPA